MLICLVKIIKKKKEESKQKKVVVEGDTRRGLDSKFEILINFTVSIHVLRVIFSKNTYSLKLKSQSSTKRFFFFKWCIITWSPLKIYAKI